MGDVETPLDSFFVCFIVDFDFRARFQGFDPFFQIVRIVNQDFEQVIQALTVFRVHNDIRIQMGVWFRCVPRIHVFQLFSRERSHEGSLPPLQIRSSVQRNRGFQLA